MSWVGAAQFLLPLVGEMMDDSEKGKKLKGVLNATAFGLGIGESIGGAFKADSAIDETINRGKDIFKPPTEAGKLPSGLQIGDFTGGIVDKNIGFGGLPNVNKNIGSGGLPYMGGSQFWPPPF